MGITEQLQERLRRHPNVAMLARSIGVHKSMVVRIRSGTRTPSVDLAQRLVEALGLEWRLVQRKER